MSRRTVSVRLRLRRGALLVAAASLVTACSAGSSDRTGDPEPSGPRTLPALTLPPPPPGVHLSFIQQRFDEGTRKAGITVINNARHAVRVRSVDLAWPGYPGPPQELSYAVPAGLRVDLPYRLPDPSCRPAALKAPQVAVVATPRRVLRRRLDDAGVRFLTRIWEAACNQRRLARAVRLSYGGPWRAAMRDGEPVLRASLVLTRTAALRSTAVTLTAVQGSPLFDLALGRPRSLAPDVPRAAVPLLVDPGRCDDHARAAATTPFTFRVWATLGDDPSQVAVVAVPSRRDQARMGTFLDRVCTDGGQGVAGQRG